MRLFNKQSKAVHDELKERHIKYKKEKEQQHMKAIEERLIVKGAAYTEQAEIANYFDGLGFAVKSTGSGRPCFLITFGDEK